MAAPIVIATRGTQASPTMGLRSTPRPVISTPTVSPGTMSRVGSCQRQRDIVSSESLRARRPDKVKRDLGENRKQGNKQHHHDDKW